MTTVALLFLGAVLTFVAGYALAARQRRIDARLRLYLDVLPELRQHATMWLRFADQTLDGAHFTPGEEALWPGMSQADPVYRAAVVAGGSVTDTARVLREQWQTFVGHLDRLKGGLTRQIVANADRAAELKEIISTIDRLTGQLERKL